MSQTDNLYSEISKTRAQFNTLLAGYWKQGLRPVITNLGTFSDGTRVAVIDQYRDTVFYLITDNVSGLVKTSAGILTDPALVVRFAGTQAISITGTPSVNIGTGGTVTLAAGAQVRTGIGNGTTLAVGGSLTAPGLGANISGSVTLGNGINYDVWCLVGISLGVPAAADLGNMIFTNVPASATSVQLSYGVNAMGLHGPFYVAGTGQLIHVDENLGGATAGVRYSATIWAVPVP
jgi:hypothetical protein